MSVSNLADETSRQIDVKAYSLSVGVGGISCPVGNISAPLGIISSDVATFSDLSININQSHTTTLAAIATPFAITDRKGHVEVTAAGGLASGATAEIHLTGEVISADDACLVSFYPGADIDSALAKLQLGVSEVSTGVLKIKVINNDAGAYTAGTFAVQFLLI